jgi:hypothetical protein
MKTHTPGPWKTTLAYDDPAVVDYDGTMIAMAVMDEETPQELETIVANARLIAAAPQLLSELKSVTDFLEQLVLHERVNLSDSDEVAVVDRLLMNAAAAIASAEGRA